jgi:hypothetical protein
VKDNGSAISEPNRVELFTVLDSGEKSSSSSSDFSDYNKNIGSMVNVFLC